MKAGRWARLPSGRSFRLRLLALSSSYYKFSLLNPPLSTADDVYKDWLSHMLFQEFQPPKIAVMGHESIVQETYKP